MNGWWNHWPQKKCIGRNTCELDGIRERTWVQFWTYCQIKANAEVITLLASISCSLCSPFLFILNKSLFTTKLLLNVSLTELRPKKNPVSSFSQLGETGWKLKEKKRWKKNKWTVQLPFPAPIGIKKSGSLNITCWLPRPKQNIFDFIWKVFPNGRINSKTDWQ